MLCVVTGTLISPDGLVLSNLKTAFFPENNLPHPAGAVSTLVPYPVYTVSGSEGEISVSLVPGRYQVRVSGHRTFSVQVPEAAGAVLAQIQDMPPVKSLTDAEMAVLAAEAARDLANAAANKAELFSTSPGGGIIFEDGPGTFPGSLRVFFHPNVLVGDTTAAVTIDDVVYQIPVTQLEVPA